MVAGRPLRAWVLVLWIGVTACAPGAPARAAPIGRGDSAALAERIRTEVAQTIQKNKLASMVVAVVAKDGLVFAEASGSANREDQIPATIDTPYRWGSNSKLFVMLALLQLVEQGKVDLDQPLVRYIPEFSLRPPAGHLPGSASWDVNDITLRAMLAHHSGIPNDYLRGMLSDDPLPYSEFPHLVREMRAQHPVGLIHSYSNLAYSLLGLVVERQSGSAFNAYVTEQLFEPLGMSRASFLWNDLLRENTARSYEWDGTLLPRYSLSSVPAGGLKATTREMAKFASVLLRRGQGASGAVVSRRLFDESTRRQNSTVPLDFDMKQGLAWFIDRRPVDWVGHTIEHGGAIAGHHSSFVLSLDHGVAVLAVTNSNHGGAALNRLTTHVMGWAIEFATGTPTPPPRPPPPIARGALAEELLMTWAGAYSTRMGSVSLVYSGGSLQARAFDRHFVPKPLEDGTMGLWVRKWGFLDLRVGPLKQARFSFERIREYDVVVAHTPEGRRFFGVRYEPQIADPIWRQRVGLYVPEEVEDRVFIPTIRLFLSPEGVLLSQVVQLREPNPHAPYHALHPLDDVCAVSEGLGRNQGVEFRFDEPDAMTVMGLRLRRAAPPPAASPSIAPPPAAQRQP